MLVVARRWERGAGRGGNGVERRRRRDVPLLLDER